LVVGAREIPPDRNPALVFLARLSPGSQPTMRGALDKIAQIATGGLTDHVSCPWAAMRYQHAAAILAKLRERYSANTVNRHRAALRGVLRECWRLGLMDAESYRHCIDVERVRGQVVPRGRALDHGELRALFSACADDSTPAGARDAGLLAVLYGAGIRRAELVALDLEDYTAETGALLVRSGKGNKQRIVYATNGSRDALDAWLQTRGPAPGPLFWPVNKGGRMIARRMTPQAVLGIARKRAADARVRRFSPHDLRRSFISDMLDTGVDVSSIQQLAGHASPSTTVRYDRRGERAKRKAAESLHVPFVPQRRPGDS
jgi:integrase